MLKRLALLDYALLALPMAFVGMPLYVHAPDFYATQYDMSLSTLAAVLLVLRVIDAVQDPLIGHFSDRLASHRYRLMLFACVILVLGFWGLFNPVPGWLTLSFAVTVFLSTTAFSIININLGSLGALWSDNKTEQARITGLREGLGIVGLILAVMLPTALGEVMPLAQAFQWLALLLGVFVLLGLWRFSRWSRSHEVIHQSYHKHQTLKQGLRALLKGMNAPMKHFYLVYATSTLAAAMPAVLVLFFIRDRLDAEPMAGYFLLTYFLSGIVAMPLWKVLSHRYSPAHAWLVGMVIAIIGFCAAFTLGAGDVTAYFVICALSGLALGGDLALPPAMMALHMHEDASQHSASSQYSILAFLTKSSLAFAGLLALPALEWAGFTPGEANSEQALLALSIAYALVPTGIKLISAALLWQHIRRYAVSSHPSSKEDSDDRQQNTSHPDHTGRASHA